jgi:hypothetical protein
MNQLEELFQEEIYKVSQKTLVMIPTSWTELNPNDHKLLVKILSAVKLNLSSVQILVASTLNESIFQANKPDRILLFGVAVDTSIPKYQPSDFHGIQLIVADSLNSLDEPKKKVLWAALKTMFAG